MKELSIKKVVKQYTDAKEVLDVIVDSIWESAKKHCLVSGVIQSFDIIGKTLYITWSDTWNYGGYETDTNDYPVEILWTDYELYFDNVLKEKELEKIAQKKIQNQRKIEQDLLTLKELTEKYNK